MAPEHHKQRRWADRGWYLVTEFGQSRAERYRETVELAKKLPNYVELLDENLHVVHRNIFRREDLTEQVWRLLDTIRPWQSARGYVKGDELEVTHILAGLQCFVFEKDELECDPDPKSVPLYFGCPRSGIGLWLTARAPWYLEARPQGATFRVPKEILLAHLRRTLAPWRICPNLDLPAAEELLRRLPDEIDVAQDRRWQLKSNWWHRRPQIEPASPADYYQFLLEHLYARARGEPNG